MPNTKSAERRMRNSVRKHSQNKSVKSRRKSKAYWRDEVDAVLITETQIARRVAALSREIERDFAGRDLVIVAVLNGTVMFLADLMRGLSIPLRLDFIGVSSYRLGTESG